MTRCHVVAAMLMVVPIVVLVPTLYLLFKGPRTGLTAAFLVCGVVAGLQFWAIMQSRSSTAAIGILFIPGFAAAAGFSVWSARRLLEYFKKRGETQLSNQLIVAVFYLPAIAIAAWTIHSGFDQRSRNAVRDQDAKARQEQVQAARSQIEAVLRSSPGRETEALEQMIESHPGDEMFTYAALGFSAMAPDRLEKLAEEPKFESSVLANKTTKAALIEKIYNRATNKDVYFTTLALHQNTPVAILRDIDAGRVRFVSIDNLLASNPSVPVDILTRISKTSNGFALMKLASNPSINCEIARNIEVAAPTADGDYRAATATALTSAKARACR